MHKDRIDVVVHEIGNIKINANTTNDSFCDEFALKECDCVNHMDAYEDLFLDFQVIVFLMRSMFHTFMLIL